MPVHVRRLRCRVTVRTGRRAEPVAHHPEGPARPELHYALPAPAPRGEAGQPEPAQTVTEYPRAAEDPAPAPDVKQADPRAVADRVYDLMRQEITDARLRGGSRRKG